MEEEIKGEVAFEDFEYNGERYRVLLKVTHPNVIFRFCRPLTYNHLDPDELAFLYIEHKELGWFQAFHLDRNEIISFQLGLALIADEALRTPGLATKDIRT